ncbi:hypothetical protein D3C72_2065370 [compost metagenome]
MSLSSMVGRYSGSLMSSASDQTLVLVTWTGSPMKLKDSVRTASAQSSVALPSWEAVPVPAAMAELSWDMGEAG